MNRTIKGMMIITSIVALILLLSVSSTFATPDLTAECGGCHTVNPAFIMASNSTGNATVGESFTLRITCEKPTAGGFNFWLSVQTGWADNDDFNFTPASIQDGSVEDLSSNYWNVTHDFTFIPESVGNYTIRAWCSTSGGSQFIDIPIEVLDVPDVTPPIIDSPSDINYDVVTTGHTITWNATDDHPTEFNVQLNGTVVLSGGWDGQPIVINVDYLGPGTYEYKLTVFDKGWNNATDSVIITVTGELPTTATTTTTTTSTTTTSTTTSTSTTTTTTTGGGPGTPADDDELVETATFSLILVSLGVIVGILSFLLIFERWRS